MKKFLFFLLFILILTGCSPVNSPKNKLTTDIDELKYAQTQTLNYLNYQSSQTEIDKVKRTADNNLYYYAADDQRYIFPNHDIFRSWFGDYEISTLEEYDLNTFYQTQLAGNVTFRPGTLMQTETDSNIYLVVRNGRISAINQNILADLYGNNWQKQVYSIPNFYFTHYKIINPITAIGEFTKFSSQITINQDKGLE